MHGYDPGVYQLHLLLRRAARIPVGRLGTFDFPAGRYVYTGSALNGLAARVGRHRRRRKRLHWHIDYLLLHARIQRVTLIPTRERRECALNRETLERPGAQVLAPGFGASDCRCASHLVYLGPGDTGEGAGEGQLCRGRA